MSKFENLKVKPLVSRKSLPGVSGKSSPAERARRTSSIPEESVSSLPKLNLKINLFPKTNLKIQKLIASRVGALVKGIQERKDVINKTSKELALNVIYSAFKEDENICISNEAELMKLLQEKLGSLKLAQESFKSLHKGLNSETSKTLLKIYKICAYKKILLCDLFSLSGREKIKEITDNYSNFFKTKEDYAECLHFLCEEFSEDKVLGTFLLDKLIQISPFKEIMMKEYSTPSFFHVREYLGKKFEYSTEKGKIQISISNPPRFIQKVQVELNFMNEIFDSKFLYTDAIKDYSGLCDDIRIELKFNTCVLIYKNQLSKCKNDLDKMKLLINFKEVFPNITDYNFISDEVDALKDRVLKNILSPHIKGTPAFNEITSRFMSFLNENYSEFSKENSKSKLFPIVKMSEKKKTTPRPRKSDFATDFKRPNSIKNDSEKCLTESDELIQLLKDENLSKEKKEEIANNAILIATEGIHSLRQLLPMGGGPLSSELAELEDRLLEIIDEAYSYIELEIVDSTE